MFLSERSSFESTVGGGYKLSLSTAFDVAGIVDAVAMTWRFLR